MSRKKQRIKLLLWTVLLLVLTLAAVLTVTALQKRQKPVWDGGYAVHISEVMTENTTCPNAEGAVCDWVEIENTSSRPFDLSGYYLTDQAGKEKYAFPAGTAVPAKGYLVVWCSAELEGEYAPFALKKEGGESVCLMNSNRVVMDSALTVPCRTGQSLVRAGDGSLVPSDAPTPGYPNDEAGQRAYQATLAESTGGTLVLSEIMAANTLYFSPDGTAFDWIEVCNPSDKGVSLAGYRLSDREDKLKYSFPEDRMLGPGEYLVIWCSPDASGALAAPFALAKAGGETVVLTGPGGSPVDSVTLPPLEKNLSYARTGEGWEVSDRPTPGYSNDEDGYAAYQGTDAYRDARVAIAEVMVQNRAFCVDADGDFSDWIELVNQADAPVSLGGWYLSDSEELLTDWVIPDVTLQPGERLLVYASGKARTGTELHASFALTPGETVYLVTPTGAVHASLPTDDIPEGQSLALGEDGTYHDSLYPTPGLPNDTESYLALAESDRRDSPLLLWEAVGRDSQRGDWVEVKNVSDSEIDLGDYYLTDNLNRAEKFQVLSGVLGPGELAVVSCSAFGLNAQEDDLYLCRRDGRTVDWAWLRGLPRQGSYGRMDGETGYFYFTAPTPGGENAGGRRMAAQAPSVDVAPGVYDDAESLTLTITGENVRYTTDGSTPTENSPLCEGPVTITNTTVLRLRSCPDGQIPSEVVTLSYFLRENSSLPIVSLVTDSANLFGPQGIYTNHDIAWQQEWEREASLSLFEEDGSFTIDCGVQIHGRTSRSQSEKRSMKLKFRGRYGGDLHYDVFGDGVVTDFSSLLLRGTLQGASGAYIADDLFGAMAIDFTDVPAQNTRFVSLYINGEYWGIYSIREKHGDDFFASHTGVSEDSVQVYNGFARYPGTFSDLLTYAETHYLGGEAEWKYMQEHLDIPVLIDWLILECWSGDIDVYENVRFYSSPEYENNRVLYGLADMDLTMSSHETFSVGFGYSDAQLHWIIPNALLANAEFKDMFLTRLGQLLNGELSDAAVLSRIDALAAQVAPEADRDQARWGWGAAMFPNSLARLKDFADGRAEEMRNGARAYFGLSEEQMQKYFG